MQRIVGTALSSRMLSDGGCAEKPGGTFRVDATAWGILALRVSGAKPALLERLRARLAREQGEDGRVCVDRQHPESYWPTALAILAWHDSQASQAAQSRAIRFLLETTGVHYRQSPGDPFGHNTLLKGWAWVGGTHSWVEPTALSIVALQATGFGRHDRVREAVLMILDRQLPHGGWNYGNTLVYGRALRPMPESTGAALAGLDGLVNHDQVARSLDYLQTQVGRLQTPLSLGWSLLGLAAWGRFPSEGTALIERCLSNQSRYGEFDTAALCLLLVAGLEGGLLAKACSS